MAEWVELYGRVEDVSKGKQCGLRSALPLALARKPNKYIAQGIALGKCKM